MTPTPDEICERLLDEEMRLAGQAIDRGCVDSSLSGILAREAADLIQQQQATIERLSAALAIIERGTEDDASGKPVKITLFRMRSIARAALWRDAK
jgi:hypothetical protein